MVSEQFFKWATGFSGCDGGDIGSPSSRSIWFCGIEWGGEHPADEHELTHSIFTKNLEQPNDGYQEWTENIAYIFNWQAMKLLNAIHGGSVLDYKKFAYTNQPFVKGAEGFFKMNLYPLAFKNTSHELWKSGFSIATGLASKQDYISWIKENRFPILKRLVETHVPKLVVCVGKSYLSEFASVFSENASEFKCEVIDGRELNWTVNKQGSLVVVIPFMVNRNGLTKNVTIQKVGNRIGELLLQL